MDVRKCFLIVAHSYLQTLPDMLERQQYIKTTTHFDGQKNEICNTDSETKKRTK
jgi:hypothetical protein